MNISERISHILLEVSDLEKSTKFYQDILGFEIVSREKMKDERDVVVFKQGIGLTSKKGIDTGNKILNHIGIKVNDIDLLIQNLDRMKIKIIDGPSDSNYGTKLYFLDPDGIKLECHEKFRS
jgi:catechol 2,3-dioxygenase-like lactoylglutathione lyase family enzyme